MSRRRSDCSCTWHNAVDLPVAIPVMTHRLATCPQHGDDTDWWKRTRSLAATLKVRRTGR